MESFPPRQEIAKRWKSEGDPADRIADLIRRFEPTVLLTFDPDHGFTGHPEHQLTSRFATEAVRRAAKGADAHRVEHVYHLVNKYWFFRVIGGGDPNDPTEIFDAHVPCGAARKMCIDVALAITRAHRSQAGDMGRVRMMRPQFGVQYLRRIDPFDPVQAPDPFAPVAD
jgi:LmbE family N-acetylglucosaminyl deacetylase